MATVLFSITSYSQSTQITLEIKSASAQTSTTQNLKSQAFLLNQQGVEQLNATRFEEALETFQQLLTVYKTIGDRPGEDRTLNSIATVYSYLEKYDKSLNFYQQALAIRQEVGDRKGEGITLNGTAVVYRSLGKYDQALECYQQALTIRRELGDRQQEGITLSNIAGIYQNQGLYDRALDFYKQGLAIYQEVGDRAGVAINLNNLGAIYNSLGKYDRALELYQEALVAVKESGNKAIEGTTLNNIGEIYNRLGEYAKAEKILFEAIAIWDAVRAGMTDTDKITNFERQADTYGFLQTSLVNQNKTNKALEIAERGRARAYIELLANKISDNPKHQLTVKPPTIEQIQQIAKTHNSTIIEYSIIDNQTIYIWAIQPTGKITFRPSKLSSIDTNLAQIAEASRVAAAVGRGLPQSDNILAEFVRGAGQAVGAPTRAANSNNPPCRGKKCLQQMYQLLIEPIADLLPTNPESRIIFIPHQSLLFVPFPALEDASGKFLIEKHTILTAPAIQVLDLTRKSRQRAGKIDLLHPQQKDVLIVGNPAMPSIGNPPQQLASLPGSEAEAIAISQLFNTKPLIGKAATESLIKQQMPDAKIIHLATHGLLNELKENDIPGAIALSPSEKDDGFLTSREILDLSLRAQLVVLSACNTGRGRITGDGAIGLSRSLITAGVASAIVSLWYVPDSPTSFLMVKFYHQLQANSDKAQALRQAMLATMKEYPNATNWAAFTLIGEAG